MKRSKCWLVLGWLPCVLSLGGCTLGVLPVVTPRQVPVLPTDTLPVYENMEASLYIAPFIDRRLPAASLATVGRLPSRIEVGGAVSTIISDSYSRAFTAAGIRVALKSHKVLQGELIDWHAETIDHGATVEVVGRAHVRITLKNQRGTPIFVGNFIGEESRRGLIINNGDVEGAVVAALEAAMYENLRDPRFVALLRG